MELIEHSLVSLLAAGDKTAFETLFKEYFKSLHGYALSILQDESTAEEMVQQVFYRIWERKERLAIHTSFKAFLYRAVHNECINYLKHRQQKTKHYNRVRQIQQHNVQDSITGNLEAAELANQLQQAISSLPEQCGLVFCLSRFEELKYREIAARLGISVKTVEAQVTKAMKLVKKKLGINK